MMSRQQFDQQQLGQRIADARVAEGLKQADLATALGLDRTAVAKVEAGRRRVSAVELARIAAELKRPIDWFLIESSPTVVSRRTDARAPELTVGLDRAIDKAARDVEFLLGIEVLRPTSDMPRLGPPRNPEEAESAAGRVRSHLGAGAGPLTGLDQAAERLGLLCFSLGLGSTEGDGTYTALDGAGVAVINGDTDAGRRRFTLAHEIGHHIFADEYSVDLALADVGSDTERLINAFAVHLLLPRTSVTLRWRAAAGEPREKAIRLGVEYRVSWSALCGQLENLGLLTGDDRQVLLARPPTRADFLELGMSFVEELSPPTIPRRYAQAVLQAFRSGRLGADRVVDLLWGSVTEGELPPPYVVPIEALQREFDPLS